MISIQARSSIRGLKKCIACGKYNGIRAKFCKNKLCTLTTTYTTTRRKPLIEPVQLIGPTEFKLYSVRIKDRGPEIRSFVKITEKIISSDEESCIINRNAICYVDTCKYDSNDAGISCKHVQTAIISVIKAAALEINESVMFRFELTSEMHSKLWKIYCDREQSTPTVQRISKSVFAVSCNPSQLFPTGFLHTYLTGGDVKLEPKFSCACKKIKISVTSHESVIVENEICVHLYLLMAALLSNDAIHDEFKPHSELFLKLTSYPSANIPNKNEEFNFNPFSDFTETDFDNSLTNENIALIDVANLIDYNTNAMDSMIENYDASTIEGLELTDCQIELMDQFKLTDQIDLCQSEIELTDADLLGESLNSFPSFMIENDKTEFVEENKVSTVTPNCNMRRQNKFDSEDNDNDKISDEQSTITSMEFECWFEFVVERINAAMDFNGTGFVNNLIFHVSNTFFEQLKAKFSIGNKRRLPNSSKIIKSGKYTGLTNHTWKFHRLDILRKIFKTKHSQLDDEKIYTKTENGEYALVEKDSLPNSNDGLLNSKFCKIQPSVFKTFLIVNGNVGEPQSHPFTIEWIPNVFPNSKFGEMRISFHFGFKKNNDILKMSINKNFK